MQELHAATSTASAKVLIGPAVCYAGVHALAESVHQNCVLGRCANLYSIIVLQSPLQLFKPVHFSAVPPSKSITLNINCKT